MAIDTSIYGNLLTAPRSALQYQQDYAAQDDARAQRSMNALLMQEQRAKLADAEMGRQDQAAYRNLLAQHAGKPQAELIPVLEQSGTPLAMTRAQELRKAQVEEARIAAQTEQASAAAAHARAQADDLAAKARLAEHDRAVNEVLSMQSPQDAMRSLQRHAPKMNPAEVQEYSRSLLGISTPEQWQQWQDSMALRLMDAKAREEIRLKRQELQQRKQTDASTLANRPLIADPNNPNNFVPNIPLQQFEKDKAKAGSSNVNVKVDAKLGEGLAKEIGPMMADSLAQANGARQSIDTADQLIKAIDSGKVIAGPGADYRLLFTQIAQATGVGGKDGAEKIANTRAAIQGLAKATLDARGSMKGQGSVSDYEGRVLARAASGEINELTPAEIKLIAQVNKRLAVKQVELHNKRVDKLKANPSTKDLADFYESIQLPPDQPGESAPAAVAKPFADAGKEARYQAWKKAQAGGQ